MLPNFLIAGAAKAGSSTIYHYLSLHPEIFMPEEKEPAFFTKYFNKGLGWYESLFASTQSGQIAGEATVEYMVDSEAPYRIAQLIPDTKLIFVVRNPIDRAWSHYWHRVKGGEEMRSFETILKSKKLEQEYPIKYGMYYKLLKRYYGLFNKDQIKIIVLEEAKKNFPKTLEDVYIFLGVNPRFVPANVNTKNKSAMHRLRLLARVSSKIRQMEKLKLGLPLQILSPLRFIFRYVNKRNMKDWDYPSLSEQHRKELKSIFAEDISGLNNIYPGVARLWEQ